MNSDYNKILFGQNGQPKDGHLWLSNTQVGQCSMCGMCEAHPNVYTEIKSDIWETFWTILSYTLMGPAE